MANGVRKINEYIMAPNRTIIIADPSVLSTDMPDGTIKIDPTLPISTPGEAIKIKKTGGSWTTLSPKNLFGVSSITNDLMAVDSIMGPNIKSGSILTAHIGDAQVTNRTLANNAVINANITDGTIAITKLTSDLQVKINTRAQIATSSAPPASPALNDLWIDTTAPTVFR